MSGTSRHTYRVKFFESTDITDLASEVDKFVSSLAAGALVDVRLALGGGVRIIVYVIYVGPAAAEHPDAAGPDQQVQGTTR